MSKNTMAWLIAAFLCIAPHLDADVPSVRFRRPDIPGFLQSMEFQTVQMQVFPREVSGMVPDPVSDLSWNPAILMQISKKSVYMDFHSMESAPVFSQDGLGIPFGNARTASADVVAPRWFTQTSVRSMETSPLYDFGIMLPVNARLKIGIFNRTVFDYGPFLQGYGRSTEANGIYYDSKTGGTLIPQRLETDHNQQTVLGNQVEAVAGYRLSGKWDLGFRFGHMVYDRHGDLVDDRWAKYPHSSSGNLQDESLKIRGHHVEAGLGLMFHPDSATGLGMYAGIVSGNGSEKSISQDTSRTWSELDVDPKYYDKNYNFLTSDQTFKEDGSRPQLTLNFEKRLSPKWVLRSFLSGSWSSMDVTGDLASADTTANDRTFDYYESSYDRHLRRLQGHGSRASGLSGDGTEKSGLWKGFVSVVYAPKGVWSLFGGVHVQRFTFRQELGEGSNYRSHRYDEYSMYKPETGRDAYNQQLNYSMKSEYSRWSVYIPVGFRMKVAPRISVLLGTGVAFTVEDQSSEGDRVYPIKTTQKWKDGKLVVGDKETDRYEVFSSNPAKVLSRQWSRYFGLAYQHPSGANVYLKFADDFSKMSNWAFGFEMNW